MMDFTTGSADSLSLQFASVVIEAIINRLNSEKTMLALKTVPE